MVAKMVGDLRVESGEFETEADAVLLYIEEDVEDAQAFVLPGVHDLLDAALVQ